MRRTVVFLLLLLIVMPAWADEEEPAEKPKPLTLEQVADEVLEAFEAKNASALEALAERDEPDPWLVADELLWRRNPDAAEVFARAAPRPDTAALPAYIEQTRKRELLIADRQLLEQGMSASDPRDAMALIEKATRDPGTVIGIRLMTGRGLVFRAMEKMKEAADAYIEAGDAARALGWLKRAAWVYERAMSRRYFRSDFHGALEVCQKQLELARHRKLKSDEATVQLNIGALQMGVGRLTLAERASTEALHLTKAIGDRGGVAGCLVNLGNIHQLRGAYGMAIEYLERGIAEADAAGDVQFLATGYGNLSTVRMQMQEFAEARRLMRRAIEVAESLPHSSDRELLRSGFYRDLAKLELRRGNHEKALETLETTLAINQRFGNRKGVAKAHYLMAGACLDQGRLVEAKSHYEEALKLDEAMGSPDVAVGLVSLSRVLSRMGMYDEAAKRLARARQIAESLEIQEARVWVHLAGAEFHRMRHEYAATVKEARQAVRVLAEQVRGLGQEEEASAREAWQELFELGLEAALQTNSPGETWHFLEHGRAGALLQALGGRGAMRVATIPEALLEAEARARARETQAARRLRAARTRGSLEEARARRAEWSMARSAARDVVLAIQRTKALAANLVYPEIANLEVVQAQLTPSQALVIYALNDRAPLALVVTTKDSRLARLAPLKQIKAAHSHLALERDSEPNEAALRELRDLLVTPLALDKQTTELMVAPDGILAFTPFSLLVEHAHVSYVSSATTYSLLRRDHDLVGSRVLALGDPAYEAGASSSRLLRKRSSSFRLVRLPATAKEASAVADVKLIGSHANETELVATLKKEKRWRAVHFACHGYSDADNPTLSWLALTPTPKDDGFLTALEVLRMKIPADLVVLSACETGKGRYYQSEGLIGLTRTFLIAGAPRVLCSLWKVDDEATQTLMVKFYELWNPKDGKGIGAAEALQQAQAFVRSREKWRHPYYWAAWVLWGLPD